MPTRPVPKHPSAFLDAVRDPGRGLKDRFRDDPEGLAARLGLKLPKKPVQVMIELGVLTEEEAIEKYGPVEPGLRELVLDVCSGEVESAVAVGPRGGGKSQGVSFIEFYFWIIKNYDALNLGGSELQASNVYQYLIAYLESDPYWKTLLKEEPQITMSVTLDGAWIKVLTASPKSVRSPHAGGEKVGREGPGRGGLLVLDEEAEAERDVVEPALATINTAEPSVNVRCSTFHKATGTFREVVDNHVEMGYKLYRWDIFDVVRRCGCQGVCQSEEPCFREDHVENIINPETGEEEEVLIHKAYCGGRAMYGSGWATIKETEKLFRRWKRNHSRWEVEAMGSRPTSKGMVIRDLVKFNNSISHYEGSHLYKPGGPITVCVDWGTVAGAVGVWQEQGFGEVKLLHADQLEEAGKREIFGKILEYVNLYIHDFIEVAADIGGGGNYNNEELRSEYDLEVRDVNFEQEKEAGAAAWNSFNEAGKCEYAADADLFHEQVRGWRRTDQGRIVKRNDHLCDMSICFFSKFIDQLGLQHVKTVPRSFVAGDLPPSAQDDRRPYERVEQESSVGLGLVGRVGGRGSGVGLFQ